jgi:segregation and condensation protein A
MSETWTVHTDVFEGPLDLLLYLVKRDGIDVRQLPVARIADSYLAFVDRMRELNLSLAGDWLVMAATLVHLKSLELLPRIPTALEEEEDPRAALVARLEEYQRYKEAAAALELRPMVGRDVFVRRPVDPEDGPGRPVAAALDAFGLLELYFELVARSEEEEPTIKRTETGLDFGRTCERVLAALAQGPIELGAWLRALTTRAERVLAFVAALEMIRQGWIDALQEQHRGPVSLSARTDLSAVDLELVTGRLRLDEMAG